MGQSLASPNMKQLLLICAVVALVGCGPTISDPIVEKAIRVELKIPTGKLTKADYEKIKELDLSWNQLTKVPKGLENLTQLKSLLLYDNPDLTKAQIAELQKALPKCKINSNPKK